MGNYNVPMSTLSRSLEQETSIKWFPVDRYLKKNFVLYKRTRKYHESKAEGGDDEKKELAKRIRGVFKIFPLGEGNIY
jgi:hypothetical protein